MLIKIKGITKKFPVVECIADIPLSFIEGVSSQVTLSLARRCSITTIEELLSCKKSEFENHIRNEKIYFEIIALHEMLNKGRIVEHKVLKFFRSYIRQLGLKRLTVDAEKKLLGLYLFSRFLIEKNEKKKENMLYIIMPELREETKRSSRKQEDIQRKGKREMRTILGKTG